MHHSSEIIFAAQQHPIETPEPTLSTLMMMTSQDPNQASQDFLLHQKQDHTGINPEYSIKFSGI